MAKDKVRLKCKVNKQLVVLFTLGFFFFSQAARAVTVSLSNYPTSIFADEFNVTVTIDGAQPGINYLRIDLFKEGTTNYFGETYNGADWYGDSDGAHYLPIHIGEEEIATASVKARVGSPTLVRYPGPGSYKLKARRYTESGSAAPKDDTNFVDVAISVTRSSPTPTPDPTPKASSSPSPSVSPTSKPTPKPTPKLVSPQSSVIHNPDILGESIVTNASPLPSASVTQSASPSATSKAGALFLTAGILFSSAAGYVAYRQTQKPQTTSV